MPAGVWWIGIDKIRFRGESEGLPEIRALKNPVHRPKYSGTLGDLVCDFRDVRRSEPMRLPAKRYVKLSLAIESHDAVEARPIQEYKRKRVRFVIELVSNFIIYIFSSPP